jgi:hypothetical protein
LVNRSLLRSSLHRGSLHRRSTLCIGLLTTTAFAALAGAGSANASPCSQLDAARWLLGEWVADSGERVVTESWRASSEKTFEGAGVTRAKASGEIVDGEALRLVEMTDAVFYVAKVAHNEYPVAFRLIECDDGRLVFENPTHDFPQRLEYRRVGEAGLKVDVSAGSRGFTLDFRRPAAP